MKHLKYVNKIDHSKQRVIHQGQRKLLLGEMDFLTRYGHLAKTVLYIGSAPGIHFSFIVELFPNHNFILYDPAKFYTKLFKIPSITIHNKLFTDEEALLYINYSEPILFISDIRQGTDDEQQFEIYVQEDMDMQRRWVEQIKPVMASLKMRLSYKCGIKEYLDGDLHLQAFPPISSTETRLYTDGKTTKLYNNTVYEEQMFYFNNQTRIGWYDNKVYHIGIDNCYDCCLQLHMIYNYLLLNKQDTSYKNIVNYCKKIDKVIGKSLWTHDHGKRITKYECDELKKEHMESIKLINHKK